jgi:TonB family protein
MLKKISILLLIFVFNLCIFSQTEKYTAPVNWERYKISDRNSSILFPKMPILVEDRLDCSEKAISKYAAYADGVVYGLTVTFKSSYSARVFCKDKKRFDDKSFEDRVKEIKAMLKIENETKLTQNNFEFIKIKGESFTYWLTNDFKNKRWFEVWTTANDDTNAAQVKEFIESFRLEKNPSGIEIKNGSPVNLGDETADEEIPALADEKDINVPDKKNAENVKIILKPRASYTDAARREQVQGTVSLKVTFSSNGGIAKISIIKGLPYGITEQAVAAARKIVFLPAQKNGIRYSVTKQVEYNFVIY